MTTTTVEYQPDTTEEAAIWFRVHHANISDTRLLALREMWANPYGPPEPARLRLLSREVERRGLVAR